MTKFETAKLYVGCGLSKAPQDFQDQVEVLKETLRSRGDEVFDFVGLVAGTAADVYNWDIGRCVGSAQMIIGVCDEASIGLGWEMGVAAEKHKIPVLATAHVESAVTRLVHGAAEVLPNVRFEPYEDLTRDIPRFADEMLVSHLGLQRALDAR